MSQAWRWAGACSVGSSHIKSGLECQDRASCVSLSVDGCDYVSVVVSDGAGSAAEAARGASIVCTGFQRLAVAYLRGGGAIEAINGEMVADWVDDIRERISTVSMGAGLRPRDYAATLVAALISSDRAVVAHVGDGAAVFRSGDTGEWFVPSWPFHGEYASTTRFVIDDPQAIVELVHVKGPVDRFAIFSDGMENLVLDHRERTAPAPFFERFLTPVANAEGVGRDRALSRHLRSYLDSDKVCEATDDDKSMILGARK